MPHRAPHPPTPVERWLLDWKATDYYSELSIFLIALNYQMLKCDSISEYITLTAVTITKCDPEALSPPFLIFTAMF